MMLTTTTKKITKMKVMLLLGAVATTTNAFSILSTNTNIGSILLKTCGPGVITDRNCRRRSIVRYQPNRMKQWGGRSSSSISSSYDSISTNLSLFPFGGGRQWRWRKKNKPHENDDDYTADVSTTITKEERNKNLKHNIERLLIRELHQEEGTNHKHASRSMGSNTSKANINKIGKNEMEIDNTISTSLVPNVCTTVAVESHDSIDYPILKDKSQPTIISTGRSRNGNSTIFMSNDEVEQTIVLPTRRTSSFSPSTFYSGNNNVTKNHGSNVYTDLNDDSVTNTLFKKNENVINDIVTRKNKEHTSSNKVEEDYKFSIDDKLDNIQDEEEQEVKEKEIDIPSLMIPTVHSSSSAGQEVVNSDKEEKLEETTRHVSSSANSNINEKNNKNNNKSVIHKSSNDDSGNTRSIIKRIFNRFFGSSNNDSSSSNTSEDNNNNIIQTNKNNYNRNLLLEENHFEKNIDGNYGNATSIAFSPTTLKPVTPETPVIPVTATVILEGDGGTDSSASSVTPVVPVTLVVPATTPTTPTTAQGNDGTLSVDSTPTIEGAGKIVSNDEQNDSSPSSSPPPHRISASANKKKNTKEKSSRKKSLLLRSFFFSPITSLLSYSTSSSSLWRRGRRFNNDLSANITKIVNHNSNHNIHEQYIFQLKRIMEREIRLLHKNKNVVLASSSATLALAAASTSRRINDNVTIVSSPSILTAVPAASPTTSSTSDTDMIKKLKEGNHQDSNNNSSKRIEQQKQQQQHHGFIRRLVSMKGFRGKLNYATLLMVLLFAAPVPRRYHSMILPESLTATTTKTIINDGGGGEFGYHMLLRDKYGVGDQGSTRKQNSDIAESIDGNIVNKRESISAGSIFRLDRSKSSSAKQNGNDGESKGAKTDAAHKQHSGGGTLGESTTLISPFPGEIVAATPSDTLPTRSYVSTFIADAVRKIGPAVIRIDTEKLIDPPPSMFFNPRAQSPPRDFFGELDEEDDVGQNGKHIQQGQGSGIIFSEDGLVLTNAHVVDGTSRVTVTLTDGRRYVAEVKGVDEMVDLAVLKLISPKEAVAMVSGAEPPKKAQGDHDSMGDKKNRLLRKSAIDKKVYRKGQRPDVAEADKAEMKSPADDWDGQPLPVAGFGNSDYLQVGEWVIAVGNPIGLDNTVTMGIVSNIKRSSAEVGIANKKVSFIQTDAAINPGNSGGPLVNEHGEIIGINTCILANAEGIGFAIPINKAKDIMFQLAEGQNIKHGYIGIVMTTVTPDFARQNNENPNSPAGIIPEVNGAMIMRVMQNTPASTCGLRRFDVVLEIGGDRVKNAGDAQNIVDAASVGEDLELKVLRGDREMTLLVKPADLAERLREAKEARQQEQQRSSPGFGGGGRIFGPSGEGGRIYVLPIPSP